MLSMTIDNQSSKEHLLRNATSELEKLKQQLEGATRERDSAFQENRCVKNNV